MAKKKTSVEETPFEMIPSTENKNGLSETIPTSFDQLIQRELTKFDVVVPAVAELSKEFLPLKISSVDDTEGYAEVSKALRFVVSKRTAVEEKRKELKADSLAYGRAVDARAKEITEMLSPVESHLRSEKDRIDLEKDEIKRKEEEAKQAIINNRIEKLLGLRMWQTMTEFVWKSTIDPSVEFTFPRINLELYDDEQFEEFIQEVSAVIEKDNTLLYEQEAKRKAEQEALAEEQKKLQDAREALQAEQDKIKKEMDDFKQQRATLRNSILVELGLGTMSFNRNWIYLTKYNATLSVNIISYDDVLNLTTEEWDTKLIEIKAQVTKLKADDDAETIKREEAQKAETLRVLKIQAENEAAAEKERIAGLSDKDKFIDYLERLIEQPVPEMSTKKWQGYITSVTKSLTTFKNMG